MFGVARDDSLVARKCHYTLNSGPGVMNKSTRVHARIQEFLSGTGGEGEGGGGRGPTARKQSGQCFFSHQLTCILQFTEWIKWFYYRGEEGVQLLPGGGGV